MGHGAKFAVTRSFWNRFDAVPVNLVFLALLTRDTDIMNSADPSRCRI